MLNKYRVLTLGLHLDCELLKEIVLLKLGNYKNDVIHNTKEM